MTNLANCFASLSLGAPEWLWPATGVAALGLGLVLWSYLRTTARPGIKLACAGLKLAGLAILVLCLVDPLISGTRPRPGSNVFALLADNSQSLSLQAEGSSESRGEQIQRRITEDSAWSTRLGLDFDLRRFAFDARLRSVEDFAELDFRGDASSLGASLAQLAERYRGRPLAGVLLFSDGNATDEPWFADADNFKSLPPIYPVGPSDEDRPRDIAVRRVAVSQTSFEDAPVTLTAEIAAEGFDGTAIDVEIQNEAGERMESRSITPPRDRETASVLFQLKPEKPGVSFYRVRAAAADETHEATLANNTAIATVDRGGGPYRVLYVAGRPNWEFKFLRRALESDRQVELVGLIRIAKREPKFDWRGRAGDERNPLFRGFDEKDADTAENYDQPVLVRMGTRDDAELRDGFPKSAADLFAYHAVILDDVEADFFTRDQQALLAEFVRRRGGGLLALGGAESFRQGGYQRTPVGEMLPVYLDRATPAQPAAEYRLSLTREGWLQPWARLRATEDAERERLATMPKFHVFNRTSGIKPGAITLAEATLAGAADDQGKTQPALVAQRFGEGRVAALLIGDLWRWQLRRDDAKSDDLAKAWRQTVRWLLADVPGRVEIAVEPARAGPSGGMTIQVRTRDAEFRPLDNAAVKVHIQGPDGEPLELTAAPADAAGSYEVSYVPREAGAYHLRADVQAADGSLVGSIESGWAADPAAEEFRRLSVNRELLERLADETGGEVVAVEELDAFVASLPNRKVPVVERWTYPLWHQSWMFLLTIGCFVGEWGLRRWKGLA